MILSSFGIVMNFFGPPAAAAVAAHLGIYKYFIYINVFDWGFFSFLFF